MTSWPFAGALMMTFFAPASRCAAAFSLSVKRPVHSSTMSTPSSFHGSFAGSFSARILIVLPPIVERAFARPSRAWLGAAVDGVVVVEVRERLRVGQVVDGDDLEVRDLALVQRADDAATDATEAVDGDLRGHGGAPRASESYRAGHRPEQRPAPQRRLAEHASAARAPFRRRRGPGGRSSISRWRASAGRRRCSRPCASPSSPSPSRRRSG